MCWRRRKASYWVDAHLSIGTSLHGSIEGRRDDIPDPLRSDPRRSEGLREDICLDARKAEYDGKRMGVGVEDASRWSHNRANLRNDLFYHITKLPNIVLSLQL